MLLTTLLLYEKGLGLKEFCVIALATVQWKNDGLPC